jgi:mannose-6-phosphate isomerase-like protein (cupin superfamily)
MNPLTLSQLLQQQDESGDLYQEFLRVPAMSAGIYRLPAGADDRQKPHTEDELYYIVQGQAILQVGDENIPVQAGSFVFVEANAIHRFHTITNDIVVLVVFAPAEYSNEHIARIQAG